MAGKKRKVTDTRSFRSRRYAQRFPCGCPARAWGSHADMVKLKNGTRVCSCGKVWGLIWVQVAKIVTIRKHH